ncbi:hypothetical protein CLI64_20395 [Nostoc sp. CENA543]|uniref:hypothetical protein n=1 Tax=Nostoc sp. CENA543 TaxID=1869241 RepID=UPI000CA13BE7|nr:hypothetical protein [Nostoc sp. CENA543]AUT02557.1 hypothetical protein CLI64_20395 [Nostoc sp. CENA543]
MRITEHTPNKLTLHNSALKDWIIGSIITSLGIVIPVLYAGKTIYSFNCKRDNSVNGGICQIQEIDKWGASTPKIVTMNELKGANLETRTYRVRGGKRVEYNIKLLTKNGDIHFTSGDNEEDISSLVNQINDFINYSQASNFQVKNVIDNTIVMYTVGGLLLIFGISAIFADDIMCSFDKESGKFFIRRKGLLGERMQCGENINISDICIEKNSSSRNSRTGKIEITYKLNLILKSGESLLLHSGGSSHQKYMDIEKNIRQIVDI